MRQLIIAMCLLFLNFQAIVAQETKLTKSAIVLAKIQNIESTGKRHNSYFFTFKIVEVMKGNIKDSVIKSQEIYSDFGGSQILSKIYPDEKNFIQKKKDKPEDVIIKFNYNPDFGKVNHTVQLKWVAEKHRRRSLERLEELIDSYISKNSGNIYRSLLLKEAKGLLFFGYDDKAKVVVETRSGSWHLATLDKQE